MSTETENAARTMAECFGEAAKTGLGDDTVSRAVALYTQKTGQDVKAAFPLTREEDRDVLVQGMFNAVASVLRPSGGGMALRKAMQAQLHQAHVAELF